MKKIANNIGVDAGIIMICDASYLDECGVSKRIPPSCKPKIFDIPIGTYKVVWMIPKTYSGKIEGKNEIKITSGKLLISDPCYVIGAEESNDWIKWLDKTAFGKNLSSEKAFIIDEMGGDGCYTVNMELEEI